MITKSILGTFKHSAINTLMLKKDLFRWKDSNGDIYDDDPTMLKLIFLEVNPATKISLQFHKDIISSARLGGYGNNVNSMLNAVENAYDTIISNKVSYDDYNIHIFKASNDSKKTNTNKSPINPERLVYKGAKRTID